MAILESNTDLDVKGRVLATTVPNSTGSIVTWNASTKVFGLRTNAQIIADLGLQSKLTAGSHINITSNSISAILTDGVWLEDSAGNRRIHVGSVSSTNDFLFRSRHTGSVEFKWQDATGASFMEINGTTLRVQGLAGPGIQIINADSSGSLFRTNIDTNNIALQNGTYPNMTVGFATIATNATKLQTARTINGTSFDGTANIVTARWGTARNITIGNTTKSVNGSGNVSWSLAEIGIPAIPTNYITTNTTQTGLSGDKTTSGTWNFASSAATSINVIRTSASNNSSIGYGVSNSVQVYTGLADSSTFAIGDGGGIGNLNTVSNRWMWVDNTGRIYSKNDGNSSQWKQAYDWGDFRDYGLGRYVSAGSGSSPDTLGNNTGFYLTSNAPTEVGGGNAKIINLGNPSVSTVVGQIAIGHGSSRMAFRISQSLPWYELISTSNLNSQATSLGFIKSSDLSGYATESWVSDNYIGGVSNILTNPGTYSGAHSALPLGSWVGILSTSASGFPSQATGGIFSFGRTATNITSRIFGSRSNVDGLWYSNGDPSIADIYQVASREWSNSQFATISSIPTVNNGQLTLSTGTGLTGSATFTANQSGGSTFTVGIASTHKLPTTAEWNALPTTNTTYTSSNGIQLTGANFTPVYGTAANTIAQGNDARINNGNTAFGWGNYRQWGLGSSNYNQGWAYSDLDDLAIGDFRETSFIATGTSNPVGNKAGFIYPFGIHINASVNIRGDIIISHGANRLAFRSAGRPFTEVITEDNLDSQATSLGYIKSGSLGSYVPTSRTITINGVSQNLSANRTWTIADTITRLRGTASGAFTSGDLTLLAGANTTITQSGANITIASTNTNTTYTAGTGLSLTGTVFGQAITTSGTGTYVQSITQTASGFQVNLGTPPNTNTTYSNMTIAELNAGTVATARTISASVLNQWLNGKGFSTQTLTAGTNITISGNTISATNTNTTYTAGTGLSLTGTTFANTAPNATHTGDVTGATALTIANNAVTFPKIQNIATQTFLGRATTGTGNVEALTVAQMQSLLGFSTQTLSNSTSNLIVSNTVQRAALTGDVTAAQNSNATTISNGVVTNAKLANMGIGIKGRNTGTGAPMDLTIAQAQSMLGITAVNNGTFQVQGTGSLTGSGSTSANASANTSASLDLTNTTKNDIQKGVYVNDYVQNQFDYLDWEHFHDASGGGVTIDVNESFNNIVCNTSAGGSPIIITDHHLNGAKLYLQGANHGTQIYTLNFIEKDGTDNNVFQVETQTGVFTWSESLATWIYLGTML